MADSFRLLVESEQDHAIFMLDPAGQILTWNRGAERIKGYAAAEIIGRHFSTFYLAEDRASNKPEARLRTAAREGRAEDEGWRQRKDGTRFWANAVITALYDEAGTLFGFGKVTRDLTHERGAAEDLRRSEERFRLLIEGVSDYAIYLLDPLGNVSSWNSGAQKIKGYAPSEIIGKHYSAFFTPEDIAAGCPANELKTVLATGHFEEEGWRVRQDGTRFWANVVLTVLHDESGAHVGFAKVTRDLTNRRNAEITARELLREQAARTAAEAAEERITQERERYKALSRRLEVIFEGIADGVTVQEASGEIVFANSAAATICGFDSVAEFLRAPVGETVSRFDLFDEKGRRFERENLPGRQVFQGAESASATMRVRERASGKEWWTVIRARPVRDDAGRAELVVNIWHDVSSARRREEHEVYLSAASTRLGSSLDYEVMLRSLAGLLVPNLADWCSIHLLTEGVLENVAVAHVDPTRVEQAREYNKQYPPDPSAARGIWNVIRTGQSELHQDISDALLQLAAKDPEHLQLLRSIGMKSVLTVPVRVRDRVVGALSLVSAESAKRYDEMDRALAEELGRRVGSALENVRLYAAEKKAREQLELVARAGDSFSGTLDYEATLRSVVHIALPVLGDLAFLHIIEGTDVRCIAGAYGDAEANALLEQTMFDRSKRADWELSALVTGNSGFHPNIDHSALRELTGAPVPLELLRRLKIASLATVPIKSQGELLGALTVCFGKSGRRHMPEDVKLTEEIARRAAVAVMQARLFSKMQAAAEAASQAARAAEEASRVKDEFLATVSHELRTPLNAIMGWASLLQKRDANPNILKGLEVIYRNAHAQAKIIEDVLDVSRIVTGKLRLELTRTDLNIMIRDAIEVVRPSASAKNISLEFSNPTDKSLLVADPERLQQVVWNLLSNSIKFTDSGGSVAIAVSQEQSSLAVTVTDSGRGIDPDFLPYVFDRFKQADGSTTRRVGGLGLGLAIVRHIVELHGGRVAASSAGLGKGATFSFRLPVRALAQSSESPNRAFAQGSEDLRAQVSPVLNGLRVLVADDEPDARDLLRTVLEQAGARVEAAASAAEAFDALQWFRPSVIVSDIGMPEEDGYGLIQRIRALDLERGGLVPAIALTAYARAEDKAKALAAGFSTHIAKPVISDELLRAVADLAVLGPRSPASERP